MFAALIAFAGAALIGVGIADGDPLNFSIGLVMVVAVLYALTKDGFESLDE